MAAAIPLSFDLALATPALPDPLTPEDAAFVRSFIALCEEEDAREPGLLDREIAASEMYGNDVARELADIEAGRHPLQPRG